MAKPNSNDDETVLSVENLQKTFGDGDDAVRAVDGVSFEVESGSVVGLLGPNGAGKTTLIKSMLGMVFPDAGTVRVTGINVRQNPNQVYDRIGAILEGARNIYWRLTVRENLEFFAGLGGGAPGELRERHDQLLEQLDLLDRADTTVNELSRGMKQKVSLASTLSRDVDIVFMDEPTLGLDVESARKLQSELKRLARRQDVAIILSSHDMSVIEAVCDRVLIIENGSVITDAEVEELLGLFQKEKYRVTTEAPLAEELREEIQRSFHAEVKSDGDLVHLEVTVNDCNVVYELLDMLVSAGESLQSIRSVETDLEEVFVHLTDGTETTETLGETRSGAGGSDDIRRSNVTTAGVNCNENH